MAKFETKIYKLTIEAHPNADKLALARVGDYVSVVGKDQFKTGDLGAYIQEGSVVPEWLLKRMNLWKTDKGMNKGMLAGPDGNRVKAAKFRGQLSQGLVYGVTQNENCFPHIKLENGEEIVSEGQDIAELLGVTKYEPPIPIHMSGEVWNAFGYTIDYDIENIKKYNLVFQEGEPVGITEKIHGTFGCIGWNAELEQFIIHSKGLGAGGLAFKLNEQNENNLYVRAFNKYREVFDTLVNDIQSTYVLGEIFGPVQDLRYGFTEPQFRVFDVFVGTPGNGRYLNLTEKKELCQSLGLQMVPLLYEGPFSSTIVRELTEGNETVSGTEAHIREGVIITSAIERRNQWIGRSILKSVSEKYLLRKNEDATEFA